MPKKTDYTGIIMIGLLVVAVIAVINFSGCELPNITINAPAQESDSNTGPQETTNQEETQEITCDYEVIDEINTMLPGKTTREYKNYLPIGSYQWVWSFGNQLNVVTVRDSSSLNYYASTSSKTLPFAVESPANYGLSIINPHLENVNIVVRLEQWICSNDPKNFDPHMFDSPSQESTEQYSCTQECLELGYYMGFDIPGDVSETDCAEWNNVVVGPCCCATTPIQI